MALVGQVPEMMTKGEGCDLAPRGDIVVTQRKSRSL